MALVGLVSSGAPTRTNKDSCLALVVSLMWLCATIPGLSARTGVRGGADLLRSSELSVSSTCPGALQSAG